MSNLHIFNFSKFLDRIPDKLTTRVRLFTGYRCNIDCKFCFYRNEKPEDIKEDIYKQIKIAKDYGVTDWDISGGEPTILPYWFDLLSDLKKNGFNRIAVITNGYKLSNKEFFKKSIEHGLNEVLFSLHGPTKEIHDSMTGVKGSFKKVMSGIEKALELGILLRINTVVTKDNYKELEKIATLINQIQPHSFNFLPFRIENSAEPESNALDPLFSAEYMKKSIDILNKNIVITVRYIPFCLMEDYEQYVCNYLQRTFDLLDWSEGVIRILDCIRRKINIPETPKQSFEFELSSIYDTLHMMTGFKSSCLKCKNLFICDGIWKGNANIFGTYSYVEVPGEKIKDLLHYKRSFKSNG